MALQSLNSAQEKYNNESKLIEFWRKVEIDAEYLGEQLSELDQNYAYAYVQLGWMAKDFLISLISASLIIQRSQHTNGDFKGAFTLVVRVRNASLKQNENKVLPYSEFERFERDMSQQIENILHYTNHVYGKPEAETIESPGSKLIVKKIKLASPDFSLNATDYKNCIEAGARISDWIVLSILEAFRVENEARERNKTIRSVDEGAAFCNVSPEEFAKFLGIYLNTIGDGTNWNLNIDKDATEKRFLMTEEFERARKNKVQAAFNRTIYRFKVG